MSDPEINGQYESMSKQLAALGLMGASTPTVLPPASGAPPAPTSGPRPPIQRPPNHPIVRPAGKASDFRTSLIVELGALDASNVKLVPSFTYGKCAQLPGCMAGKVENTPIVHRIQPMNFPLYGYGWAFADQLRMNKALPDADAVELARLMGEVGKYYRGNGDPSCVHARFMKFLRVVPTVGRVTSQNRMSLLKSLPVDPRKVLVIREGLKQNLLTQMQYLEINLNAGSGLPFTVSRKVLFEQNPDGLTAMIRLFLVANEGGADGVRQLARDYPQFFTPLQRAKVELYESTCLTNPPATRKARPYWCFNAIWTNICMLCAGVVKDAILCFLVPPPQGATMVTEMDHLRSIGYVLLPKTGWWFHPQCGCAVGFSWMHGGAAALMEAIEFLGDTLEDGEVWMVAYSDDQLYVRKFEGKLWAYTPDVDQMDARITKDHTAMVDWFVQKVIVDPTLDQNDRLGCLRPWFHLWHQMAVSWSGLVDHGAVISVKDRLATGIAGTTIFDQMGSLSLHFRLTVWNRKSKALSPTAWIAGLAVEAADFGFPFKGDSLGAVPVAHWNERRAPVMKEEFHVKFLGYWMVYWPVPKPIPTCVGLGLPMTGMWVPQSNVEKLFVSFMRPGRAVRPGVFSVEDLDALQMTRGRQLYVQGLWQHPVATRLLVSFWMTCRKKNLTPIGMTLDSEGEVLDAGGLVTNVFVPNYTGPDWPTLGEVLDLYAPRGWIEASSVPILASPAPGGDQPEWDLGGNNWADEEEEREKAVAALDEKASTRATNIFCGKLPAPDLPNKPNREVLKTGARMRKFIIPGGLVMQFGVFPYKGTAEARQAKLEKRAKSRAKLTGAKNSKLRAVMSMQAHTAMRKLQAKGFVGCQGEDEVFQNLDQKNYDDFEDVYDMANLAREEVELLAEEYEELLLKRNREELPDYDEEDEQIFSDFGGSLGRVMRRLEKLGIRDLGLALEIREQS